MKARDWEVWTWIAGTNYHQYQECRLKYGSGYTVQDKFGHYTGFKNQSPFVAIDKQALGGNTPCYYA